ncbi:MAG: response regulator [Candidatus Omnitrophica bacterium]|nr:response regulator [Candidatus Omnitrophota bacterium]
MKKILLVDDDRTVQKLLGETLRRRGFEVVICGDGVSAIAAIKKEHPDAVILDVMMPELNGYDVCHSIKFDPQYKSLPIILVTSREQELDPRLAALLGIEYMHKPCSPQDILMKIDKIFSGDMN